MLQENKLKFLQNLKSKMFYFNYSKNTINSYIHYVDKFLNTINKPLARINSLDYSGYLLKYNFSSTSQQNQIISSLKFLYDKVLNKKYKKINFSRPRKEKHLPKIIDGEFLKGKIFSIENTKHKAIISLAYSVGLRVSEVINPKIEDIDSKRMIIQIKNSKGNSDRIVPLSSNILNLLRKYFIEYKPNTYLFNGQNKLTYSTTSCNKIVKKYINKDYHFHLLRHSCFTHLVENDTSLRLIQKLAGHKSIKTTEIYTHVSSKIISNINLPL